MKTLAEYEAALGPRDASTQIVGGAKRDAVRAWLQLKGLSRDAVARLSMTELRNAYCDATDDALIALLSGTTATPAVRSVAPPVAPAPAGVDAILEQMRSLLTAKPAVAGLDNDAVLALVQPLVDESNERIENLTESLRPIHDLIVAAKSDAAANARLPLLAAAASGNHVLTKLLAFYKPGVELETKVCLTAPPSFGKSHSINLLGASYDTYLTHGCSEDVDEISTLLGTVVPDGKGSFTIVDGVLTQAVRAASAGKNVLFFLDEIFRLFPKCQEWLLTFLQPVQTPAGAIYRLRTRRLEGKAALVAAGGDILETLECPVARLHVISAANLGLVKPIEAFWSRFFKLRLDWNLADCTAVGESILNSFKITVKPDFAEKYAALLGATREAVKSGQLAYPADFRLLRVACAHAATPDEAGIREFLKVHLVGQVANWDGDLGDTDATCTDTLAPWLKELE